MNGNGSAANGGLNGNGSRVNDLFRAKSEGLQQFVARLRRGVDPGEQPFFGLMVECAHDLLRHPSAWIDRVFRSTADGYRADILCNHSVNVSVLAMVIGREMSMAPQDILLLGAGAVLHDVGMFAVPQDIVESGKPLSDTERNYVEAHPEYGARMLRESGLKEMFVRIAHQEHERADGTGYPRKLQGADIEYYAKIIAFCDGIESLTHYRPHRGPIPFLDAFSLFMRESRDLYPRRVWMAALKSLTPYPSGSLVRLSTGKIARVLEPHSEMPMRPSVEILDNREDDSTERSLDLRNHPMITIQEALP